MRTKEFCQIKLHAHPIVITVDDVTELDGHVKTITQIME